MKVGYALLAIATMANSLGVIYNSQAIRALVRWLRDHDLGRR